MQLFGEELRMSSEEFSVAADHPARIGLNISGPLSAVSPACPRKKLLNHHVGLKGGIERPLSLMKACASAGGHAVIR
ncbi:hypothetical protein M514_19327 [Trichuris suis]|uniref:Uncharacterized protein n=1 Tax=Trichuris suis TaxID=68888 RepID=A0A085NGA5_9BILA|nr:hypothetical protein M514_19327 [Trichuris suis]